MVSLLLYGDTLLLRYMKLFLCLFSNVSKFVEVVTGEYRMEKLGCKQYVVMVAVKLLTFEWGCWIVVPTNSVFSIKKDHIIVSYYKWILSRESIVSKKFHIYRKQGNYGHYAIIKTCWKACSTFRKKRMYETFNDNNNDTSFSMIKK